MRKRLFIIFMVILLSGVAITGLVSNNFAKNILLNNIEENLRTEGLLVENSLINYKGDYDLFAQNIKNKTNKRVTIITDSGKVIGESDVSSKDLENHAGRSEIIEALKNGEGTSTRYSETEKQTMYYYAKKINTNGETLILRLSVNVNEIKSMHIDYIRLLIFACVIGVIVCSVAVYFYVEIFTKPVRMLTSMATTISLGQYEKRININSKDELGQLGHAFNLMAKRLQETITDLSDKQSKLISILASMDDGVIVVDNNEKIILINSAAQKLFNLDGEMMGRYFIEAIRNNEIHDMIKMIPEDEVEIELSNPILRYLRIKATRVINYNENLGVMLFIQDITKIRALEQMRTDFVANVSHELKSPLTSIKGFAETLKFVEDKPTRDKFLDIINIESERLTRLINDILTLSEIESKDFSFNFEKINVNKFVEEIFYIKEPIAKDKDIKLSYTYENDSIYIYGDGDKFRQMLINLIDNAIKYTNNGGFVKIITRKTEDIIDILVQDNGIGIPKDKIPRLFERFYRVDKGRSREMGGTGLGLAIVKHIVNMFGGGIKVESEVGKGSTFTLSFTSGEKLDK